MAEIKPAGSIAKNSSETATVTFTNRGSIRQYAKENGMQIGTTVTESKASGFPTVYLRKADGKIEGHILSKSASAKFPVGSELDLDNLYVTEVMDNETSEVKTKITMSGGKVVFVNP